MIIVDPERVRDVPVLGLDPVVDCSIVLGEFGFAVETYEETPGWHDRLVRAYSSVIDVAPTLRAQTGDNVMDALLLEMSPTLEIEPYPRRIFAVARPQ